MTKQLEKLFVRQRQLDDSEKQRMTDTQYAYGLLLHAANTDISDDSDKVRCVITIL